MQRAASARRWRIWTRGESIVGTYLADSISAPQLAVVERPGWMSAWPAVSRPSHQQDKSNEGRGSHDVKYSWIHRAFSTDVVPGKILDPKDEHGAARRCSFCHFAPELDISGM
jgi:hypothetical protein